jgi:replicative DNA helicase
MTLTNINQYGPGFQVKVLAALLNHKEFLINIHDIISEEYFESQAHKWIIKEILKYYDKYHTTPSLEVLKVEIKKLQNEVLQIAVKEQLREAYKESDDLIYVEEEFSAFCKNQMLKKALLQSVDLLQAGDYDSIKFMIESAMKAGQDKNLGHEYNKDIETRYREEHRISIPTPWNEFNTLLQGGLGNGDFGLIFGNPGGGKSWALVALGGHAVKMGFNVIHYTLELGEDYVGRRYDAYFTQIPVNVISANKSKVESVMEKLTRTTNHQRIRTR